MNKNLENLAQQIARNSSGNSGVKILQVAKKKYSASDLKSDADKVRQDIDTIRKKLARAEFDLANLKSLCGQKDEKIKAYERRLAKVEGAPSVSKGGRLKEHEILNSKPYIELQDELKKVQELKSELAGQSARYKGVAEVTLNRVFDSMEQLVLESHVPLARRELYLRLAQKRDLESLASLLQYLEFIDDDRGAT